MFALLLMLLACTPAPAVAATPPAATPPAATAADAPPNGDRVLVRHILIAYRDAAGAPPSLRRSKKEAQDAVAALRARVLAGEDFATLARGNSEDTSAARGGLLPAFGHGSKDPSFEAAAFALADGELSPVVETPFGFHLILRQHLVEAHLAHILVKADESNPNAALTRAQEAQTRLEAGEPFARVAADSSDGPVARWGGDLGWYQPGDLAPGLEAIAFALAPGQTSALIQTQLGYHIFRRVE